MQGKLVMQNLFVQVHPELTEAERKQVCRSLDVHKLSMESCVHVSQNERVPLHTVIRVVFSEHMKLRNALTGAPSPELLSLAADMGGSSSSSSMMSSSTPSLHALTQFARASTSDSDPQYSSTST
jgi:hypothetical protein